MREFLMWAVVVEVLIVALLVFIIVVVRLVTKGKE